MEIPEVRRRLRAVIEEARQHAAARRERSAAATRDYEAFLERAIPTFHTFAAALVAEGYRFKVFTPAGSVRLASERGGEDFIEILLDAGVDPPRVTGHTSRGRGSRSISTERPLRAGTAPADLTEEDVLAFLVEEIAPFVER